MDRTMYKIFVQAAELDPDNVRSCVSYWWAYSFLDGIKDQTIKEKCAVSFTKMAQFLYENNDFCTATAMSGINLDVTIFPIIRRVVVGSGLALTDPEAFIEFCKEFFRERVDHYEKLSAKSMHFVDFEAQAACDCAEYAIKVLK
jgi:hypothetical protein